MGNMSKRQQLEQRADNSRRPPMGLQLLEFVLLQLIYLGTSNMGIVIL